MKKSIQIRRAGLRPGPGAGHSPSHGPRPSGHGSSSGRPPRAPGPGHPQRPRGAVGRSPTLHGTRIRANASKHEAMSHGRMRQDEERLRAQIWRILEEAKEQRNFTDPESRIMRTRYDGGPLAPASLKRPASPPRSEPGAARLKERRRKPRTRWLTPAGSQPAPCPGPARPHRSSDSRDVRGSDSRPFEGVWNGSRSRWHEPCEDPWSRLPRRPQKGPGVPWIRRSSCSRWR